MGQKTKSFHLTRVEAPTMTEALQKVRAALGSDAMIVSSRTFRRGGMLGVGGQEVVEIYAADTRSRIANLRRACSSRSRYPEPAPHALEAEGFAGAGLAPPPKLEAAPALMAPASSARGAFSAAGESTAPPGSPPAAVRPDAPDPPPAAADGARFTNPFLRECFDLLVSREVEARVAELLVHEIGRLRVPSGYPDPSRVREMVRHQLSKLFLPTPPFDERRRPRTMVLVGPTGVGKTTTIAKLAARAKINERRRVGLITLDTFRIAAVDQLEKYAEIINLPLSVATEPRELELAVNELRARQMDLVLIDSAGRSQRDELKMAELREFLAVLPEAEVHLVLSTTTHGKTLLSVANRFAGIGLHSLILTKVDETISFGALVNALIAIGRPVSFVTDGQNVPDDIVASDPERLADLVLKANAL